MSLFQLLEIVPNKLQQSFDTVNIYTYSTIVFKFMNLEWPKP